MPPATLHATSNLQRLVFYWTFVLLVLLVQRTEQAYGQVYVLDANTEKVTRFSSTFTAELDISTSLAISDPTALAVDSTNRLLIFGTGEVEIRNATDGTLISSPGLLTTNNESVHTMAAAVGGIVMVNQFLRAEPSVTGAPADGTLLPSREDIDPHGLCPGGDPNDRSTWRIFNINPRFTNISQTVSLRGLQYVVRQLEYVVPSPAKKITLINADDAPPAGGVGSTVTVGDAALGPDGKLTPGETFQVRRQEEGQGLMICLDAPVAGDRRFRLLVDVLGILVP